MFIFIAMNLFTKNKTFLPGKLIFILTHYQIISMSLNIFQYHHFNVWIIFYLLSLPGFLLSIVHCCSFRLILLLREILLRTLFYLFIQIYTECYYASVFELHIWYYNVYKWKYSPFCERQQNLMRVTGNKSLWSILSRVLW